jgi:Spy/CpxP family protein refolding chaperone
VKHLESLSAVQEAKITHIIKMQREQSLPLMERLRELREEAHSPDIVASGRPKKSRESAELRKKIHAIKKDAWLQMQKVLTTRQKIELEKHHDDESGPPRRNNPDARPAVHDSGKSFSQ